MQTPEEILKPLADRADKFDFMLKVIPYAEAVEAFKDLATSNQTLLAEVNRLNAEVDRLKSTLNEF